MEVRPSRYQLIAKPFHLTAAPLFPDPLQWHHKERDGVSNHQPHDCLFNRLSKAQIKENIKAPSHWPLWGNTPVNGEFPAQRACYAENVSIWLRHHDMNVFNQQQYETLSMNPNAMTVTYQLIYCHFINRHDDVIKWKLFRRYWTFVRGIQRSPVISPHKDQWRGALRLLWSAPEQPVE